MSVWSMRNASPPLDPLSHRPACRPLSGSARTVEKTVAGAPLAAATHRSISALAVLAQISLAGAGPVLDHRRKSPDLLQAHQSSPAATSWMRRRHLTAMPARRPCACEESVRSAPSIAPSGPPHPWQRRVRKVAAGGGVGRSFHCRSTAAPRHCRIRSSPSERGTGWRRLGSSGADPGAPPSLSHLARALPSGLLAFRLFRVLALMHAIWDA